MSEQELRDALHEYATPLSPPDGGRDAILRGALKRRRRLPVAVAAAAAVATIVGGGLWLRPSAGPDGQPIDQWKPEQTSQAPYEADPCPEELPEPGRAARSLPDLAKVKTVRFCGDTRSRLAGEPVAVDEGTARTAPEALIDRLDVFADDVVAMRAADPGRCAAISVLPTADSMVFTLEDGSAVIVNAGMCQDVQRGSVTLDGLALLDTFMAALDRQRDRIGYETTVAAPVPCRLGGQGGPIKPARERIVAAVLCPGVNEVDASPQQLTESQVARLEAAWQRAKAGVYQFDAAGDAPCFNGDDEDPSVVVRSNRGDLVRFRPSKCDTLVHYPFASALDGTRTHLDLPISLDDLGGAPR